MNGYTMQISAMLSCTIDRAKQIQDYMEENLDIDYSECTEEEFTATVIQAMCELRVA